MEKARKLEITTESWPYHGPFRITGHTFESTETIVATVREGRHRGRGEAAGAYYLEETPASMAAQLEAVRPQVEAGASREDLLVLLPACGARNALDCALWDLEAKRRGSTIWTLTGIAPARTCTVLTIGIGTPDEMAAAARALDSPKLKVKLNDTQPLECIAAVRAARPDAELVVDVNQGWSFAQLEGLAPAFADQGVAMIEQPLPRGGDEALAGYRSPVPLCADESCLASHELEHAAERYDVINIKLDKTGGLTEALRLAERARARGLDLMVGNMMGTSLAMAPAYVIAQLCRFVDLDGPLFLAHDRDHALTYRHGEVSLPSAALWG